MNRRDKAPTSTEISRRNFITNAPAFAMLLWQQFPNTTDARAAIPPDVIIEKNTGPDIEIPDINLAILDAQNAVQSISKIIGDIIHKIELIKRSTRPVNIKEFENLYAIFENMEYKSTEVLDVLRDVSNRLNIITDNKEESLDHEYVLSLKRYLTNRIDAMPATLKRSLGYIIETFRKHLESYTKKQKETGNYKEKLFLLQKMQKRFSEMPSSSL